MSGQAKVNAEEHGWLSNILVETELNFPDRSDFEVKANWDGKMETANDLRSLSNVGHPHARINDVIDESVETWKFLSAFRVPYDTGRARYTDDELDRDGSNLVQKLYSLRMSDQEDVFNQIRDSYIEIMEGISDMDIKAAPDHGNESITTEITEDAFETGFKSEEISAGSKEILTLLTQIHLAQEETDLLAVEEPELHLHPEAERKVLKKVKNLVEQHGTQALIATHSSVFVDEIEAGRIVRVERDGDTELRGVNQGDIGAELSDLGYSKSGLLQSEAVVFVEGISDKLILSEWAYTLEFDLENAGVSIVELEGQGNIGTHGRSLVKLLYSFDIPYLFIIDSDDKDPHTAIEEHKRKINREDDQTDGSKIWWHTTPAHFFAWSDSDIEHFFLESPNAIANVVNEEVETIENLIEGSTAEMNVGVLEEIWNESYSGPDRVNEYQKDIHGRMIAKMMTESELDEEINEAFRKIRSL